MTSRAPNPPRFPERRSRRELVGGALLIALFTLVFLWTPIVSTDKVLVPAQIGQRSPLTRVEAPKDVGSAGAVSSGDGAAASTRAAEVVVDTWSRYVPWALFSREAIRNGRLPLWNGLSGPGAPHFANLDAAVLSPFTLPWYVLDTRAAALWSAFARLFALGLFTFLFLREMRVAFAAAIAGSIAFQFAGSNVIGLFGPSSAAAVLAPAGLYLVERMARAAERAIEGKPTRPRAREGFGTSAALAVVVAVGYLSGGFATFLFALLLVLAYAAVRLFRIGAREDRSMRASGAIRHVSARLIAALAVAACISAVQFLPWFERMDHVVPDATLAQAREPLSSDALALDAFPDLLGSPTAAFQVAASPIATDPSGTLPSETDGAVRTDRRAVLTEYVGSLALFLAVLGACFARRRRAGIFFAVAAATWFATAHGWPSRVVLALWPGGSIAPLQQGVVVFAFSIAVLVAFALDRVVASRRTADARIAFAVLVLGMCSLWALRASADTLAKVAFAHLPEAQRVFVEMSSNAHVEAISATFCAGLMCVALALAIGPGRGRRALVIGAALALFAQTAWIQSGVNPLAPQSIVYPRTHDVEQLARLADGKQVIVLGADGLQPDTHLAYGLRQLCADDPERTRRCDWLVRAQFKIENGCITRATERAQRLFGAEIVLERNRWTDATLADGETPTPGMSFSSSEILPASPFVQRFVDVRGRPGPLAFEWITNGWRNECTFHVTLDDALTGRHLVESVYAPGDLRPRGQIHLPSNIDLPDSERQSGRKLVLTIASDDALAGHSWSVLCRGASNVGDETGVHDSTDWVATQGSTPVPGRIALQPDDDPTSLQFEAQIGSFAARSCADAARFRTVSRAYAAGTWEDASMAVMRPGFDPRSLVVLEDVDPAQPDPHAPADETAGVEVLLERDGLVHLRAHRTKPGWLVADIAWYRGWRARVDGVSVPLYCANVAFSALALPAGDSTIELEFAPSSVRTGIAISCVGLLALLCMMVVAFVNARSPEPT